jgi:ENTS family enterobactin (siderophore) exporter
MALSAFFVDLKLLRDNAAFRRTLVARTVSLSGVGLLTVALPLQVHALTGSSAIVGAALALEGIGMVVGLLVGGIVADRHDRRRLILLARGLCGLGFAGLAANCLRADPSLAVLIGLSAWDGFFSGISVTAMAAAIPAIVGRDNLLQARALSVIGVRLATVLSPLAGGAIIAAGGVGWTYLGAAAATLVTVLTLLGLPALPPAAAGPGGAAAMLAETAGLVRRGKTLLGAMAFGAVMTLPAGLRVVYPELAEDVFGGGAVTVGLMTAAVPAGATLGALVSGRTRHLARPGRAMLGLGMLATAGLLPLGATDSLPLGLAVLWLHGIAGSLAGLVQYTLIQGHAPDRHLGRINSLWTAQEVCGTALAAAVVGGLAHALPPSATVILVAAATLFLVGLLGLSAPALRRAPFPSETA